MKVFCMRVVRALKDCSLFPDRRKVKQFERGWVWSFNTESAFLSSLSKNISCSLVGVVPVILSAVLMTLSSEITCESPILHSRHAKDTQSLWVRLIPNLAGQHDGFVMELLQLFADKWKWQPQSLHPWDKSWILVASHRLPVVEPLG